MAVALAGLLVSGCKEGKQNRESDESETKSGKSSALAIKSTFELRQLLKAGLSTNEILAALGTPAWTDDTGGSEMWSYAVHPFPADDEMRGSWVIGANAWITNGRLAVLSFAYTGPLSDNLQTEEIQLAAALRLYVISDTPLAGGRFIDTAQLPKLGYVGATPELVLDGLKQVTVTERRETDSVNDQRTNWSFGFTLHEEAVPRLKAVTTQNISKRLLMTVDDEPIVAPRIVSPIESGRLEVSVDGKDSMEKLKRRLTQTTRTER